MDLTGKLKTKGNIIPVSDNFNKREFVVETEGEYPQVIQFELTQQRCNLIDKIENGTEIKVHFNVRGREWTDKEGVIKVFNTLNAWKIESLSAGGQATSSTTTSKSENDDLPF